MRRSSFRDALACAALAFAASAFAQEPAPAFLPTPYSAEQIRNAWTRGFSVEMRTTGTSGDARGRMTVVGADAETCTVRSEALAADGSAAEKPRESRMRWEELRDHALFPSAKATRERAECRSQLGAMPGWRYATTDASGDALTMCFADATPGPPVEYETSRDGKRISRTEHVQYGRKSP